MVYDGVVTVTKFMAGILAVEPKVLIIINCFAIFR